MHGQLLSLPLNPRLASSLLHNTGRQVRQGEPHHSFIAPQHEQAGCGRENLTTVMEHLACFVPGNLALGVEAGAVSGAKAEAYLALAAELCVACVQMYSQQPTGVLQTQKKALNADSRPRSTWRSRPSSVSPASRCTRSSPPVRPEPKYKPLTPT